MAFAPPCLRGGNPWPPQRELATFAPLRETLASGVVCSLTLYDLDLLLRQVEQLLHQPVKMDVGGSDLRLEKLPGRGRLGVCQLLVQLQRIIADARGNINVR